MIRRPICSVTATKAGVLDVWTGSFQEEDGALVLLLEGSRGRMWGKGPLAPIGPGKIVVRT